MEAKSHVLLGNDGDQIVTIMFVMLKDIISEWQSALKFKNSKDEIKRTRYKIIESAKNLVWQDLRRFCSYGSFALKDRITEIMKGDKSVHKLLRSRYKANFNDIKNILESGSVKLHPKNSQMKNILDQLKPSRSIIFCDSVRASIDLTKYLIGKKYDSRLVIGSYDQLTKEDIKELEQSKKIDDDELERILEWFWFPWITVSKFGFVNGVMTRYVSKNGMKKNSVYHVDASNLGSEFKIILTWEKKMSKESKDEMRRLISELSSTEYVSVKSSGTNELYEDNGVLELHIKIDKELEDKRVLVTTDKLNEGANLQIGNVIIFYDQPMSIKQREQRIARARRLESVHDKVFLVSTLCGLEYAIEHNLEMKYDLAKSIGYVDPKPVAMKEIMKEMERMKKEEKEGGQTSILDFTSENKKEIVT